MTEAQWQLPEFNRTGFSFKPVGSGKSQAPAVRNSHQINIEENQNENFRSKLYVQDQFGNRSVKTKDRVDGIF
tara:strand:- start:1738 stop:1956 length:219 start_codon:yes stop_codon:yes gene_type:complete